MHRLRFLIFLPLFPLLLSTIVFAQLPVKLKAVDTPNDKGGSITLTFEGLPQDTTEVEYEILLIYA
jgi:hypothetical protein